MVASLWIDYLRFLGFVLAAFVYVLVAIIFWRHWQKWQRAPDATSGLKPWHVWMIAAAYMVSLAGNIGATLTQLGETMVWYGFPILILSTALALGALALIARYLSNHNRAWHGGDDEKNQGRRATDGEDELKPLLAQIAKIAIPAILILLLPTAVGFYHTEQAQTQTEKTAVKLAAAVNRLERLEREQRTFRTQRLAQTAETDRQLCEGFEQIKLDRLLEARRSRAKARENARVLDIPYTPELEERLDEELRRAERKYKPRDCTKLPSAKPPKTSKTDTSP